MHKPGQDWTALPRTSVKSNWYIKNTNADVLRIEQFKAHFQAVETIGINMKLRLSMCGTRTIPFCSRAGSQADDAVRAEIYYET
jgi:hypothetical protein